MATVSVAESGSGALRNPVKRTLTISAASDSAFVNVDGFRSVTVDVDAAGATGINLAVRHSRDGASTTGYLLATITGSAIYGFPAQPMGHLYFVQTGAPSAAYYVTVYCQE